MSDDRTYVDVEALKAGGVDLERIAEQAQQIRTDLLNAIQACAYAGGTGTMGAQFDENYKPNQQIGVDFLNLFNDAIGTSGVRTSRAARSFADAESDANQAASSG
ncbi:hypothetical protein [Amycolatopsis pigmentata]|uniref:WXG100 family type VII secretion target n=1 Tax=Amycolatopsis pigmentata TaxID=450801 RepID=A0ABW5G404_9PSEU